MLTEATRDLKILLSTEPFDIGHDVAHHYKVWENCMWIVDCEKIEGIDTDALQIAAWGHDLERGSQTHDKLRQVMEKHGCPEELINDTIDIINEHSHDGTQTSREAEILFDADKLEYVTVNRWSTVLQAAKDGVMTDAEITKYKNAWNKRIGYVQKGLHFACTKKKFAQNLKDYLAWGEKQGVAKDGKLV